MRTYFFDLVVDRDLVNEADSDLIFELFSGAATPAVRSGTPLLACSIEADSFVEAFRSTVARLKEVGVSVLLVEIEPEEVHA